MRFKVTGTVEALWKESEALLETVSNTVVCNLSCKDESQWRQLPKVFLITRQCLALQPSQRTRGVEKDDADILIDRNRISQG